MIFNVFNLWLHNAAVERSPEGGIRLELLVLPAAERRGGSGVSRSTAAFPPERSGGGNQLLSSFLDNIRKFCLGQENNKYTLT